VSEPPFRRVAVIGVGLIGGSILQAVEKAWPSVSLLPLDAGADLSRTRDADLVILAAPVRANIGILAKLATHVGPDAVVSDTGRT